MPGRISYQLCGENVAKARLAILDERGRPLSQQALADRAHLHRVTVAKVEGDEARVSLETLERLASALGRSREHLLGEPEQVDDFELAREQMANATAKMGEALENFTSAVKLLEDRARAAGDAIPGPVQ